LEVNKMNAQPIRYAAAEAIAGLPLHRAIEFAIDFYDVSRLDYREYTARRMAESYLRRKMPSMDADAAAVALADALARRCARRLAAQLL
jgi:hypothetical protein